MKILSGRPPFHNVRLPEMFLRLAKGDTVYECDHPELPESSPYWGVVRMLWRKDPCDRPSIDEADFIVGNPSYLAIPRSHRLAIAA